MIFQSLPLSNAYLIKPQLIEDERGFFTRLLCAKEFQQANLEINWVQINNSYCHQAATLRGLHFQRPPFSECKLIRCIRGAIWDVIVDLRHQSSTFGQWYGTELNEDNRYMMYVPAGYAHGYLSLTDHAEIIYPVSEYYYPDYEGSLHWSDADVGIKWPMQPTLVSEKDSHAVALKKIKPIEIDT